MYGVQVHVLSRSMVNVGKNEAKEGVNCDTIGKENIDLPKGTLSKSAKCDNGV